MTHSIGIRYIVEFSDLGGSWTNNNGVLYLHIDPAKYELIKRRKQFPKNQYRIIKVEVILKDVVQEEIRDDI